MEAKLYEYLTVDRVQCPKCHQIAELPLSSNTGRSLEFVGVCQSSVEKGGRCGAVLSLQVTAHEFPAAKPE